MSSSCFYLVCESFLSAFLSFCVLAFVVFFGLMRMLFSYYLSFFVTTIDSHLVWFGLVSLFNGISTFVGYLIAKDHFLVAQSARGCRIHRLLLCRGVKPPNECPGYDTKQSNGEVSVMLELWGIWSTPLLLSLLGPLWPGVVAPDRALSNGLNRTNGILMLNWIAWNRNVFDNKTVLTFKLRAYAKLNYLKLNCFWHWNFVHTLNRIGIYNCLYNCNRKKLLQNWDMHHFL